MAEEGEPFIQRLVDTTNINGEDIVYTILIIDQNRTGGVSLNITDRFPVRVYQARHPDNSKTNPNKIIKDLEASASKAVVDPEVESTMEQDEDLKLNSSSIEPVKDEDGIHETAEDSPEQDEEEIEHLYVKYASITRQPRSVFTMRRQVDRNNLILVNHENLLGMTREPFIYEGFYAVVFPYMNRGSLRSIMGRNEKLQYGLPVDLILVVLRETLNGLSVIHQADELHGEINAGHIFFSDNPTPQIKLGFSASVFDLDADVQNVYPVPEWRSRNEICDWASAPETHASRGAVYTEKSDVWLIGILAMELAYGCIRFEDRPVFNSIMAEIHRTRRLPNKIPYHYLQIMEPPKIRLQECYNHVKEDLKGKNWKDLKHDLKVTAWSFCKGKKFPTNFNLLVADCLESDPDRRPTVAQLLGRDIFNNLRTLVQFRNAVTN